MKILLIEPQDRPLRSITEEQKEQILSLSSDIELEVISALNSKDIEKHLTDVEVVAGIPRAIPDLSRAEKLQWVHSFSAGMDRVLTPELVNSSVLASNSSGIHATPIAEHIIAFLLIFTRQLYQSFRNQQEKTWQRINELTELKEKTVLVIGLGKIGSETARIASCFGAHVIALDTKGKEKPSFVEELGVIEQLAPFLGRADFVILTLPHTKETHHFINKESLEMMQSHAVLVNIGRGGVVDEQALVVALKEKRIGGAALDVTEEEPLPEESPLWSMENVIITPHHSGISERYMERAIDLFCVNLKAYLAGEDLPSLVDKSAGY
ncbi:MAG: D-2-hydroxyacid dehydrogenase [bacterium]|nr:D-2-hydroxyacid dehydrogenase [bacterium]